MLDGAVTLRILYWLSLGRLHLPTRHGLPARVLRGLQTKENNERGSDHPVIPSLQLILDKTVFWA
eukprot:scaffold194426_cov19-Prasinocladus_malaysianus.AAC.1